MPVGYFILWFLFCIIAYAILFMIQIPLRRKGRYVLRIVLCLVKAALATFLALVIMVLPSWFSRDGVYPATALYVALFGDVFSDIIMIPVSMARKGKPYIALNAIVCALMTVAFMVWGTVNMQTIRKTELTYSSEKLTKAHKLVFLSDVHMGAAQSEATVSNALNEIDGLHPDFIVLGGDITDDYTKKEEMQTIFRLLGSLNAPVYYVYGNHDRQPSGSETGGPHFSEKELEKAITDAGIIILKDNWVKVSDDLILLGKEDFSVSSRLSVEKLPSRTEKAFVLSIDHSPFERGDIVATNADLQLSGHTHSGQLFPLRLVYSIAGFSPYGKYHYGNTDVFVSSGFAGWGVPFRTEAHSEYVVVNLVPAK